MTRKLPRTSRASVRPLLLFLLLAAIAAGTLGAAACAHGAAQTPRRAAAAHATPPIVSPHAPGQGAMPRPAQYIQNSNNAPLAPVPANSVQVPAYPGPVAAQDGQWTMPGENLADWRYSALDQITSRNVGKLQLAWTFSTGTLHGNEAAPLVVGATMYVVTPYPDILYALDLNKHGALKWKFNPHPDPSSQGVACCDTVNRGAVYGYGNIYYNLLDDHTVAVNAKTGKMVWKTRLDTIEHGSTMTMAPILAKNHVIVGNSGGELGVHGWVAGLDARTGAIAWRGYSEGPDSQVLIGSGYHPYYPQFRGKNLGVSTWPAGAWRTGGGSVWGWISYDPKLNLIYQGTSNPGPWDASQRPGRNLFTSSVFARDPDNGQVRWVYQYSPHDEYDYDGINENVLLDEPIGGRVRRILLHPDRNGYVYEIARRTGQVLSARAFAPITTTRGVNLTTGQLEYVRALATRLNIRVRGLCPASPGAKDWQPSAFSPKTNLVYIPHNHLCEDKEDTPVNYIAGTPYVGSNVIMYDAPGGFGGQFTAWNPVTNRPVWNIDDRFPVWSGALATAGNVVFFGTMEGWFKAVDAVTGKLLWQFKCGSGVIGQPVSFRGPDGKQYIAVLSGVGGWAGAIVAGQLNPVDPTGALGFVGATEQLPKYTTRGGMLYVFALP